MATGDAPSAACTSLLIVDDDVLVLRMTKKLLERRGYQVVACTSGEEALSWIGQQTFDCMISDVQMPGINGARLLRAVRDRDLDLPVVLLTGSADLDFDVFALEYGAFQCLVKPIEAAWLEQTVTRATRAGRIARAKRAYVEQHGSGVFLTGDRAGIEAKLDRALTTLWVAFQPIVRASDSSLFANEALLRCDEPVLNQPVVVLDAAERVQRVWDVGRRVRSEVSEAVKQAADDALFFVNLHPSDLDDPQLLEASAPLSRVAGRVVLEITERTALDAVGSQAKALRALGYRLALDDLGAGHAGLDSFIRLEPEFVKLDTALVHDLHRNDEKRRLVGSMISLCHELGKCVIAEGVEQRAEQDALRELGCDLLQGFLFGEPARLGSAERAAI
jgi:EAL domain-containing protein (putative c-di-GMP-specific phosphodiesterase class I)